MAFPYFLLCLPSASWATWMCLTEFGKYVGLGFLSGHGAIFFMIPILFGIWSIGSLLVFWGLFSAATYKQRAGKQFGLWQRAAVGLGLFHLIAVASQFFLLFWGDKN